MEKKRRPLSHWLSYCLLPVFLSGCAAIEGRIQEGGGHPYLGVRGDAYSLAHPGDAVDPFLPPFCALDMPFSFVVDTLCLPYDLAKQSKVKKFDPHSDAPPSPSRRD